MAYSNEVREQALVHCQNGLTDSQVSEKTGVSKQTIINCKKLLFTTGSYDKAVRKSGKPYKYTPEKIKECLDKLKKSDITSTVLGNTLFEPKKSKKKKKKK